jgi:protein-disulfide isomerase
MSKRGEIRERRRRGRSQQRTIAIVAIVAVAAVFTFLLILPSLRPVGSFVKITPPARDQAQGTNLGDPQAPVTVVVFEDFQCPACMQYSQTIEPQVIASYVDTGKVYYQFKNWAFIGPESLQAANAAMCAADQNRFWDYHDILFANHTAENVGDFTDQRLTAFAESLGLDMNAFGACFKDNPHAAEIQQSYAEGQNMGVTGTPSVFVDGTQVAPGYIPTYDLLSQAINAALAGK